MPAALNRSRFSRIFSSLDGSVRPTRATFVPFSRASVSAHSAAIQGRKNAENASHDFFITNSDFQKKAMDNGWISISAGPFLDTGKADISPYWIADSGIELRFAVLHSIGFTFSYGQSLRDGTHAFFLR